MVRLSEVGSGSVLPWPLRWMGSYRSWLLVRGCLSVATVSAYSTYYKVKKRWWWWHGFMHLCIRGVTVDGVGKAELNNHGG